MYRESLNKRLNIAFKYEQYTYIKELAEKRPPDEAREILLEMYEEFLATDPDSFEFVKEAV